MKNKGLVIALTMQAAIQGAASSAALAEIAPRPVVAAVSLLSAMLATGTAAYVAATGRNGTSPVQPIAAVWPDPKDWPRTDSPPSGR